MNFSRFSLSIWFLTIVRFIKRTQFVAFNDKLSRLTFLFLLTIIEQENELSHCFSLSSNRTATCLILLRFIFPFVFLELLSTKYYTRSENVSYRSTKTLKLTSTRNIRPVSSTQIVSLLLVDIFNFPPKIISFFVVSTKHEQCRHRRSIVSFSFSLLIWSAAFQEKTNDVFPFLFVRLTKKIYSSNRSKHSR